MAHPTPILQTTRTGSRSAVQRLNQSLCVHKGEPGRRSARACTCARIVLPRAKSGTPSVPVESEASSLLVILHYLLKNNTPFMGGNVQVKMSPRQPSVTSFFLGAI
jgi:hypothetical protein